MDSTLLRRYLRFILICQAFSLCFLPEAEGRELIQLTRSLSQDSCPSWSPDGKFIAYSSFQDGMEKIWLIGVDEHGRPRGRGRKLTDGPGTDRCPSWSPDGRRIVFQSDRNGMDQLFLVEVDTGKTELFYRGDRNFPCRSPSWSPDGERIALVSQNNIAYITFKEKKITYLTGYGGGKLYQPSSYCTHPSWSTDGKRIFFSSHDLKVVEVETRKTMSLTSFGWNEQPACSISDQVCFISNRGGNYDLWMADEKGEDFIQITDDEYRKGFPSWSPNGQMIAFQSDRTGNFNIWIVILGE